MPTGTDLATTDRLLREQWLSVRTWLEELDDDALRAPSVLPGWSVAELVAHLGRALDALAVTQPADDGQAPVSLARYLSTYAERADRIDQVTRELAREIDGDHLAALDAIAGRAFAQLGDLRRLGHDPVVRSRVAPIRLSDLVMSRLVELVVHGDDLDRSLPHQPGDVVQDEALEAVSDALIGIVREREGWSLEVLDPLAWVRVATGRTVADVDTLRSALEPTYTSDALPDVASVLPLL